MKANQKNYDNIAISSRIRLARNLEEFAFPPKMQEDERKQVIAKVRAALCAEKGTSGLQYLSVDAMTPEDRQVLVEKHLISPDLAMSKRDCGVALSQDEKTSIMVNEEDHLRIQYIDKGLALREAYAECDKVDRKMEQKAEYAFMLPYGYLTACPSNVGTGMRVSVMLHLPMLVKTKNIGGILDAVGKLGITTRGIYGENTEAAGNMFQLSNRISLGNSEEELINLVEDVAVQVMEKEKQVRMDVYKNNAKHLEDKIWRSYGIFTNARLMSSNEALNHLSDIRLGMDLHILPHITREQIDELSVLIQSGMIAKMHGPDLPEAERDAVRAELIREKGI